MTKNSETDKIYRLMDRFYGLSGISIPPNEKIVATIGVFDGVHRGHQHVLDSLVQWARELGAKPMAVTFDISPKQVLGNGSSPMITSLEHKLLLFKRLGIEYALVLNFDQAIATIEPEDFVKDILIDRIGVKGVLLGYDCRWGRERRGDYPLMEKLGQKHGFVTKLCGEIDLKGHRVSSTEIRNAIRSAELSKAAEMLGRPVGLLGTVITGDNRGRVIGYPTANLDLHHELCPPGGVYATACRIGDDSIAGGSENPLPSMTYIGSVPTFRDNDDTTRIETHIFDFDGNIYDEVVEVLVFEKVRDGMKLASQGELIKQLEADERVIRRLLAEKYGCPGK